MGFVQMEVIDTILQDRFGVRALFSEPVVIHKEAPSAVGLGKAAYTRFSAIGFEIRPLPEGSGIVFVSRYSTDYLLKKYQNQARRLIYLYAKQGIYGWELTDTEISIVDGKFNSCGSDPSHFNIVVPIAFMRALRNCHVRIVEPIATFRIVVPKESIPALLHSLSSKGAVFEIAEGADENCLVCGEVAVAKILSFGAELLELSKGRGTFAYEVRRHELSNNQQLNRAYFGPDPRNEVKFLIETMGGNLDSLDVVTSKKKKESRSKYKRRELEKNMKN
jgi:ribosomal protection tetracycline resistance protein